MRILIIEDDPAVRMFLSENLRAEAFAVDSSSDGEQGSYLARTNDYDLIILDNSLPKKVGLAVCHEIRSAGKTTPIVMVSVKADIPEKVLLLREGVDDYITKPFSFEELLARIHAILRRPKPLTEHTLTIDDVSLNSVTHEVTKGGKPVYLTRKEFALLEYLLRHKGSVISRGLILEHVWNIDGDPFSNSIETHIRNLRKKIDSKSVQLIHNVPGRGYKIDLKK